MAIYTCVLLDVDNTILDFDAAERQALTDMLAEYELPHDEAASSSSAMRCAGIPACRSAVWAA